MFMGYFLIAVLVAAGIPLLVFISIMAMVRRRDKGALRSLQQEIAALQKENEALKQEVAALKPVVSSQKAAVREPAFTAKRTGGDTLPADFKFTEDFEKAFDFMENTRHSIFITGKAGTGKSTLIQYFKLNTGKKAVYLAPTGVAALNIRGKTIHSLFKFPLQVITSDQIKDNTYKREVMELFKNVDIMIVDEISMARADIIEGMDYILRKFRIKDRPFGGVQMVFIGDMYQLPPVLDRNERINITHNGNSVFTGTLHDYFQRKYDGHYFFNANAFKNAGFKYCVLNTIFRQKDDDTFIDILNAIRERSLTDDVLGQLNSRYYEGLEDTDDNEILLCATNRMVDEINKKKMDELPTKEFRYEASVTGVFESEIRGKDYPVEKSLKLKEGAQVMMIKNDKDGRWVNGSIGIIKRLADDLIDVEIHGTTFTVNREIWEAVDYEYDEEKDILNTNVTGTYSQYPLRPAWAITIHKSQGKTFEKVIIDLGGGAFAHGQTYVALSRCKTLNGIKLKKRINRKDIILDDKVIHFINDMNHKIELSGNLMFQHNFRQESTDL
jgi:ATP-dependent exoDNAse (exonuclease V) alpha subunit